MNELNKEKMEKYYKEAMNQSQKIWGTASIDQKFDETDLKNHFTEVKKRNKEFLQSLLQ